MFANDNPPIQQYAAQGIAETRRVILLVVLSIQARWDLVGAMMDDVAQNGSTSRHLWAMKGDAYRFISDDENMVDICDTLDRVRRGEASEVDGLVAVLRIPGLNLVKAGFVLQLCTGRCGCMDVHNLRRLGLSKSALTVAKTRRTRDGETVATSDDYRRVRAARYAEAVAAAGGSARLWDDWCCHLESNTRSSAKYSTTDGSTASLLHRVWLGLVTLPAGRLV